MGHHSNDSRAGGAPSIRESERLANSRRTNELTRVGGNGQLGQAHDEPQRLVDRFLSRKGPRNVGREQDQIRSLSKGTGIFAAHAVFQ